MIERQLRATSRIAPGSNSSPAARHKPTGEKGQRRPLAASQGLGGKVKGGMGKQAQDTMKMPDNGHSCQLTTTIISKVSNYFRFLDSCVNTLV
jgi:hypothetical protein